MRLRKYCVTVMDNWTPLRYFWTLKRAMKWRDSHYGAGHLFQWHPGIGWLECYPEALFPNGEQQNG